VPLESSATARAKPDLEQPARSCHRQERFEYSLPQ